MGKAYSPGRGTVPAEVIAACIGGSLTVAMVSGEVHKSKRIPAGVADRTHWLSYPSVGLVPAGAFGNWAGRSRTDVQSPAARPNKMWGPSPGRSCAPEK